MISAPVTTDNSALAASLAHWWALAGVDAAIAEAPHGWLAIDPPTAAPTPSSASRNPVNPGMDSALKAGLVPAPPAIVQEPEHAPAPMPDDMVGFLDWLATDPDQPESGFSRIRILPRVFADAEILVVIDMPTAEDMVAGRLFSGADHGLLSGMLRAVGVDVDKVAMASLLLARPAGGIMEDALASRAAVRLRHFMGLTNARQAIIFGDGTNRALEQMNEEASGTSTRCVNHQGASISAMLLPAPFVLLKHAERKAAAWGQLRQLAARS
ncbi:MAG TPA: hypothetical protein VF463_07190 [Sphingobium sp.]